ncbi:MAG: hypothetical protein K2N87_12420 [Eubacterium sp.]|nr:hypothetical protein [Eubacterium sp.]
MQETYRIGNAQSIGSRHIQSNYFASKIITETECLAVLSDGAIDHINGRRCAILAVEACVQEFMHIPREAKPPLFFDFVAARILRDMRELLYLGKTPYLSLSIQYFRDGQLFYYTVGSNRLFLFDGMDYHILSGGSGAGIVQGKAPGSARTDMGQGRLPVAAGAQCGCVAYKKGMTAGMLSLGAWEALREKELVSILRRKGHPYEKAQRMLLRIKEKNQKAAGNATVLLVEGCL